MRRRSSARGALLLGVVGLAACAREQRAPQGGAAAAPESVVAAAPSAPDTTRAYLVARGMVSASLGSGDTILQAMAALEDSLRIHGEDSAHASLYVRLGRLKRAYERWLFYPLPELAYARTHPAEYRSNEVDANYLYNGYHFRELIRRFPQSPLAEEAAWELTLLSRGGECEGYVPCYIEWGFAPVADFLRHYPNSRYGPEAVRRANQAFTAALADIPDLTEPEERYYPPDEVQALVARYDTIARELPPEPRAAATLVIADLWARLLQRARARELYQWLATAGVPGVDTAQARHRLFALSAPTFLLHPARVVSDTRVELEWEPLAGAAGRYVVLRAADRDSDGQAIGEVPAGGAPGYSDRAAPAGAGVWYRVRAETPSGEVTSNPVRVTTPADSVRARGLVWRPAERMLYVFGYLDNRFPRVLQVSERGELVAAQDAALYGVEQYGPQDHRFDAYLDQAWFVDVMGQAFLGFRKPPGGFGGDLGEAIRRGGDLVARDTAGVRYSTIFVSIDPGARQMWIAPRGRVNAFSWDYRRGIAWEGREGDVRILDAGGGAIRTVPVSGPGQREFVTAIQADPRNGGAWAYLSRAGRVVRLDGSGAVTGSWPLERSVGEAPPMAFDLAHGWLWVVAGPYDQRSLSKRSLADGATLAGISGSLRDLPGGTLLATDTAAGGVWVLAGRRLVRFGSDGARLLQADLPTR